MPNVHVDYNELQSAAGQLTAGQQEVVAQLMRLKGVVDRLVASGFVTDRASGQFQIT